MRAMLYVLRVRVAFFVARLHPAKIARDRKMVRALALLFKNRAWKQAKQLRPELRYAQIDVVSRFLAFF
jgi:hypothetical protein